MEKLGKMMNIREKVGKMLFYRGLPNLWNFLVRGYLQMFSFPFDKPQHLFKSFIPKEYWPNASGAKHILKYLYNLLHSPNPAWGA